MSVKNLCFSLLHLFALVAPLFAKPGDWGREPNYKSNGDIVETPGEFSFTETAYGKDNVKILHVKREGGVHSVKELEVATRLTLNSQKDYLNGDNADVVTTDTQKNTVYILARNHGIKSVEDFALLLANHFLKEYSHVTRVTVSIDESLWDRATKDGLSHPHSFISNPIVRFTKIGLSRGGVPEIESGIKNLRLLKTGQSGFEKFHRDAYTSLPETNDRLLSTNVFAKWAYSTHENVDFDQAWNAVKQTIGDVFAGSPATGLYSPSVQNTLYNIEKKVLERVASVGSVELQLPNIHYIPFDFSKFSSLVPAGPNNEVFFRSDAPAGNIKAVLARNSLIQKEAVAHDSTFLHRLKQGIRDILNKKFKLANSQS